MSKKIAQGLRRIPIWLLIVFGAALGVLVALACSVLIGYMLLRSAGALLASATDCVVEGEPGSSAHLNNGGTHLFTFPESAANIWSECGVWQEVFIHVQFDMDAGELETFLDSMLWDVRPLTSTGKPPPFGDPEPNPTYLYGEYSNPSNSLIVGVWIDTSDMSYRVFINVLYD